MAQNHLTALFLYSGRLRQNFFSVFVSVALFFSTASTALAAKPSPASCYLFFSQLYLESLKPEGPPLTLYANGTEIALSRAFEKEGLLYSDIAQWFDTIDKDVFERKLKARLERESQGGLPRNLTRFLQNWSRFFRAPEVPLSALSTEIDSRSQKGRASLNPADVLDYLLRYDNPFDAISIKGREVLFYDGFLSFDDLRPSAITPRFIAVGDDLGSYEVRSRMGSADFRQYPKERSVVEEGLEGPVGHQHLMHAWPEDAVVRAAMAPHYIELLDATSWYLFWRQMKRDPAFTEGMLTHPYLGVYNRAALERLHQAVVDGRPAAFKNKYRMVGARSFKGNPDFPGQAGEVLPDFELRSGNKSENRSFVEGVLAARFATGDYSGLPDFRSYEFDASAPLEELLRGLLSESKIEIVRQFAEVFPPLKWSPSPRAYNHVRNKILSPLLPWERRFNLGAKAGLLKEKQREYAEDLFIIAEGYLAEGYLQSIKNALASQEGKIPLELRWEAMSDIEASIYLFSWQVRLDLNFEKLLYPRPETLPSVLVTSQGPLDVNEIPLGIEYSFRFSRQPQNRAEAEADIKAAAERLRDALGGGTIENLSAGGHGHGLSIRYRVTDLQGRVWRVEWDGIRRSYKDGKPYWSRGGHIEAPTPKFVPKDLGDVQALYQVMRNLSNFPKRTAGGAHVNVDLAAIRALPEKEGTRRMANLIAYFESNRDLIAALWQHPARQRTGKPVDVDQTFMAQLNQFEGGWAELAELLYHAHYFNTERGRKPCYTQLNLLALMAEAVPEEYFRTIDIKKPGQRWFPAFGGKGVDRIEFRLFDAPEDAYIAALQMKYMRALLNTALNASGTIPLQPRFSPTDRLIWSERPWDFIRDAEAHLTELGLDPAEFAPLIHKAVDTLMTHVSTIPAEPPYRVKMITDRSSGTYYFKQKITLEEEEPESESDELPPEGL